MSAEVLRRAAREMRERAEAATWTNMPWDVDEIGAVWTQEDDGQPVPISSQSTDEDAAHIASWHPAVALAVADLIDELLRGLSVFGELSDDDPQWSKSTASSVLSLARAYLGEQS